MTNEDRKHLKDEIDKLVLFCKSKKIPAAFIFAENREGGKKPGTAYDMNIITPLQCNVKLHQDHITPLLAIGHGFTMIPTRSADGFYNFDNDAPDEFYNEPNADDGGNE